MCVCVCVCVFAAEKATLSLKITLKLLHSCAAATKASLIFINKYLLVDQSSLMIRSASDKSRTDYDEVGATEPSVSGTSARCRTNTRIT